MNIFISQPMNGISDFDIVLARKKLFKILKTKYWRNIYIVPSYTKNVSRETTPLYLLGNAIKSLSKADIAVFLPGWDDCKGCRIEYLCCKEYGIPTVELVFGNKLRRC